MKNWVKDLFIRAGQEAAMRHREEDMAAGAPLPPCCAWVALGKCLNNTLLLITSLCLLVSVTAEAGTISCCRHFADERHLPLV